LENEGAKVGKKTSKGRQALKKFGTIFMVSIAAQIQLT
jgi:hypothetical protein